MADKKLAAWRQAVARYEGTSVASRYALQAEPPGFPEWSEEELAAMSLDDLREVQKEAAWKAVIPQGIFITAVYCARRFGSIPPEGSNG